MKDNIQYIPIEKNYSQQSFLFDVQLAPWSNGNWLAWIAALPGCAAWGASKDEALAMLTHTTQAYLRMLRDKGAPLPASVQPIKTPVVAVTL